MIPRVIHYCWLSDSPFPPEFERYIDSWYRIMPDFEMRLWTLAQFSDEHPPWVFEAFAHRKYAFAADYIRCYALYHYGGIYLDADVEIRSSFAPLMHLPYLLGEECGSGYIDAGIMAAEPGHPLFGALLDYYKDRHFVRADGQLDTLTLPIIIDGIIDILEMKKLQINDHRCFDYSTDTLSILPYDYFSPIHTVNCKMMDTDRTVAVHHFAGSWLPWYRRIGRALKRLLGPWLTNILMVPYKWIVGR